MISRCHHLVFCREVYPDLETMHSPACSPEIIVGLLRANYSSSSSHPLNVTWVQLTAVTCAIFVTHPPIQKISHGFESPMRVPWGSDCLARSIVHRPHFVYQQEWALHAIIPRRPANLESSAFPYGESRDDFDNLTHICCYRDQDIITSLEAPLSTIDSLILG